MWHKHTHTHTHTHTHIRCYTRSSAAPPVVISTVFAVTVANFLRYIDLLLNNFLLIFFFYFHAADSSSAGCVDWMSKWVQTNRTSNILNSYFLSHEKIKTNTVSLALNTVRLWVISQIYCEVLILSVVTHMLPCRWAQIESLWWFPLHHHLHRCWCCRRLRHQELSLPYLLHSRLGGLETKHLMLITDTGRSKVCLLSWIHMNHYYD